MINGNNEWNFKESKLWYRNCPKEWSEGLPIGNGRLAAMILNYEEEDILCLNHEYLWTGINKNRENFFTEDAVKKVRDWLDTEEYEKATRYAWDHLGRDKAREEMRIDSYQPAGNLHIKLNKTTLNKRSLDIYNGVAECERECGNQTIKSEFLAHSKNNNILCRLSGKISCGIFFERENDDRITEEIQYHNNQILYSGKFIGGVGFKVLVSVFTDGKPTAQNDKILINDANELIIAINISTDIEGRDDEINKYNFNYNHSWDMIKKAHTKLFSSYMDRLSLNIMSGDNYDMLPTDERLNNFKNGGDDENLFVLYMNYGRYLLLSSSLCGSLPANLQGKWNNKLNPEWASDYHFDINLQMNYWIAENGNLGECTDALFNYIELFYDSGKILAEKTYNCRGITFPLSSDCWGNATFESYRWDNWIGAAPWLAQHFYKHYKYTGDVEFLRERAYPFFRKITDFYEDYLIKDENGVYQITPSVSPENSFLSNKDIPMSLCISCAMDVQLAYDCFSYAIESANILKTDTDMIDKWKEIRDNLPDFKIGKDGRLLEWNTEMPEKDPGHRHLSHLYGVFPSNIFTSEKNINEFRAAKKSLDYRLSNFGGHTGWSRAWTANLYARMRESEKFYEHTRFLIDNFSTSSLLDLHPPKIFQIDGNLGGAEAILQSLIQSYKGKIYVLPALPKNWKTGVVRGIKTEGGHTVALKWENGKAKEFYIEFGYENETELVFNSGTKSKIKKSEGEIQYMVF